MKKCVFFDRDGIVNMRLIGEYITNISAFKLLKGFAELLNYVQQKGYLTILITNQQGIAKGKMTDHDIEVIHKFMQDKLIEFGTKPFDDIYYCPELEVNNPWRRKPNPGMYIEAIEKWNIDVNNSWMIGDVITDMTSAKKVNLKTILLNVNIKNVPEADFEVDSHSEIMNIIT